MLSKAIDAATAFLKKEVGKEGTLLGGGKVAGGWKVRFEVVEKDGYLAKVVPGSSTLSRNEYVVNLDAQYAAEGFENLGQKYTHPQSEEKEEES